MIPQVPDGTLPNDFSLLHRAGCLLCENDSEGSRSVFYGLWLATHGNPCNGCFEDWRKCKAFRKYHSSNKQRPAERNVPERTIAEWAKLLDVSKSEVRRRKLAGTLSEPKGA